MERKMKNVATWMWDAIRNCFGMVFMRGAMLPRRVRRVCQKRVELPCGDMCEMSPREFILNYTKICNFKSFWQMCNHKRISFRDGEKNVRSSGITFWRNIIHRVPHSVISNSKFSILFPTCKWELVTFAITWIFEWYNWIFEFEIKNFDLNIETNTPSSKPSELFAHCPSLCCPCFGF